MLKAEKFFPHIPIPVSQMPDDFYMQEEELLSGPPKSKEGLGERRKTTEVELPSYPDRFDLDENDEWDK